MSEEKGSSASKSGVRGGGGFGLTTLLVAYSDSDKEEEERTCDDLQSGPSPKDENEPQQETFSDPSCPGREVFNDGTEEYIVEKIVKKKVVRGKPKYLIKWKDWPSKHNTWEPLENLTHCRNILDQFEESLKTGEAVKPEAKPTKEKKLKKEGERGRPRRGRKGKGRESTPKLEESSVVPAELPLPIVEEKEKSGVLDDACSTEDEGSESEKIEAASKQEKAETRKKRAFHSQVGKKILSSLLASGFEVTTDDDSENAILGLELLEDADEGAQSSAEASDNDNAESSKFQTTPEAENEKGMVEMEAVKPPNSSWTMELKNEVLNGILLPHYRDLSGTTPPQSENKCNCFF